MNGAYILCAIVGTGMVAASLLGASDHHGGEFGQSLSDPAGPAGYGPGDHDHQGFSWSSLPVLSTRFWIFSVAAFGLIGTVLSAIDAGDAGTRLIAAIVGGISTGMLAWLVFRLTARANTPDLASASRLSGERATVTVAIRANTPGKIRMQLQGQSVEVLATTNSGVELLAGSQVFVLGMSGYFADVVPYESIVPGDTITSAPPIDLPGHQQQNDGPNSGPHGQPS